MHNFANWVLWIYIILLLVGGLMGFLKAKSKVSLITSVISGALLALTTAPGLFQPSSARIVATVVMVILLIVFAIRLSKKKKFMPSGLMVILTAIALALWNLSF